MLLAESVGIIYSAVDIILLGVFRPLAEVGLYQVAVRTAGLILVFLTASIWVMAPWFAQLHAAADRTRLQHLVTRTTRMVFWPSLAVFALFSVGGRELLILFFGDAYARVWGVLLILAGARLVDVGSGPVITLMAMTGGQKILAWTIAATALANLLGCWLLIPRFGMYGAAISTALAVIVTNLALAMALRRRIGIRTTVWG
jgi:O-antigen/teichoic acid export membrane protein